MKKETKEGIGKWLANGNTGISSNAVLHTFLLGNTSHLKREDYYPRDNGDFNRVYLLVKYAPETFKSIKILAKESQQWKNILKFWDELVFIFETKKGINEDFYHFIDAVNNCKYGNTDYQDRYDERRKRGIEIYKKHGFRGKRLPTAPISN